MSEAPQNQPNEYTEKAVNRGLIFGIIITFTYIAYNLLTDNTEVSFLWYIFIFLISSLVISFILLKTKKT